jgi:Predicted AAA-ATPase/PD-(D/E)XK nuclease superfamily
MMKKLPAGESSFNTIMGEGWLYVDKTKDIHQLVEAGKYYFLSRPRRFGKSLTVSTLRALFEGRKELFEGLWIHDKVDWEKKHPVISLSFNGLDYKTLGLENALCTELDLVADRISIKLAAKTAKGKFKELIERLKATAQVVVLIDEYDKPINDFLHDFQQADANRDILGNFFGVLKDNEVVPHLRFVFITGVSKFSKVTLFSELNNLTDLTQHPKFSTLLGITQEELERDFHEHIEHLAKEMGIGRAELLVKIKHWYNGYTWDGVNFVYNPFSLLHLFGSGRFANYWFTSGTTSWLVRKFRDLRADISSFEDLMVGEAFFDKFEVKNIDPAVLLYQTGYLTIKEVYNTEPKRYRLGYPNHEVRSSLLLNLFQEYAETTVSKVSDTLWKLQDTLLDHDLPTFIALFKSIFADISNRLLKQYIEEDSLVLWEAYYQTVIYLALSLTGSDIRCEVQTNRGYIDAVAETEKYIYVMEFKVGKAAQAMLQIKEKRYHEKFLGKGKRVTLLGVGFDPEVRNIGDWQEEEAAK